eukprot:4978273-Amphidinium_carterae.1
MNRAPKSRDDQDCGRKHGVLNRNANKNQRDHNGKQNMNSYKPNDPRHYHTSAKGVNQTPFDVEPVSSIDRADTLTIGSISGGHL